MKRLKINRDFPEFLASNIILQCKIIAKVLVNLHPVKDIISGFTGSCLFFKDKKAIQVFHGDFNTFNFLFIHFSMLSKFRISPFSNLGK